MERRGVRFDVSGWQLLARTRKALAGPSTRVVPVSEVRKVQLQEGGRQLAGTCIPEREEGTRSDAPAPEVLQPPPFPSSPTLLRRLSSMQETDFRRWEIVHREEEPNSDDDQDLDHPDFFSDDETEDWWNKASPALCPLGLHTADCDLVASGEGSPSRRLSSELRLTRCRNRNTSSTS